MERSRLTSLSTKLRLVKTYSWKNMRLQPASVPAAHTSASGHVPMVDWTCESHLQKSSLHERDTQLQCCMVNMSTEFPIALQPSSNQAVISCTMNLWSKVVPTTTVKTLDLLHDGTPRKGEGKARVAPTEAPLDLPNHMRYLNPALN